MKSLNSTFSEIRINSKYANHYRVDKISDIKGESVEGLPVIKRKTIFTNDYINKLNKYFVQNESYFLPQNCRYVEKVGNKYIVVVEEPPAFRTLKFNLLLKNEEEELLKKIDGDYSVNKDIENIYHLNLALPYVTFILDITNDTSFNTRNYFNINQCRIFMRPQQMIGKGDYLCYAPLTNIYESGQNICFGGNIKRGNPQSMISMINTAISNYWESTFTNELYYNYELYRKKQIPILGNLIEWEYVSRTNPMFIYSANWITFKNIGDVIKSIKEISCNDEQLSFEALKYTFQINLRETITDNRPRILYYDVGNSLYLSPDMYLLVGDELKLKNGDIAYIDSFCSSKTDSAMDHILLDHNGKKIFLKIHKNCIKFLIDKIKEENYLYKLQLQNGKFIKKGDIITVGGIYSRVDYIRRSREDRERIEIKSGSNFYIYNDTYINILDDDNIFFKDKKLEKDKEYIVIDGGRNRRHQFIEVFVGKFDSYILARSGMLNIKLVSDDKQREFHVGEYDDIEPIEELNVVDYICRIDHMIYDFRKTSAYSNNGFVLNNRSNSAYVSENVKLEDYIENDKFMLRGIEYDIEFEIGDKVIIADWSNPLGPLDIKTIQGFTQIKENEDITFILSDKENNITEEIFIYKNYVYMEKIRRVVNQHAELSIGMKIKAKEKGVYNFPKKDTNIIVAILIDNLPEPMVLCSNGCTLWYTTIMINFDIIKITDKKWNKLEHVPLDINKIKTQPGDVLKEKIRIHHPGTSSKVFRLVNTSDPYDSYLSSIPRNYEELGCIPLPRLSPTNLGFVEVQRGFYDIYGNYIVSPFARFNVVNTRRF